MSGRYRATLADRKALLATRADIDRARVMLDLYEIKAIFSPTSTADRVARLRPAAAMLVALIGPLVGVSRVARWLRIASLALAAARIARGWRGRTR